MATTPLEEIFVPLLEEGVDVWRPTQAEKLPDGSYRVLATPDYDPEDEVWQFLPGAIVICEKRRLSQGKDINISLVAVRAVAANRQSA